MINYLVGAGLAVFEGVLGREIVLPNAEMPSFPVTLVIVELVTDNFGLCELGVVDPPSLLCGMRDGVASSINKIKFRNIAFKISYAYAYSFQWNSTNLPVLSNERDDP